MKPTIKRILPILYCLAVLSAQTPAPAQDSKIVVDTGSHSIFTGIFRSVWARLRSLNPPTRESARSQAVYTAGIRGAESTDTLLKPYWKDDLTQDQAFQRELQQFTAAQLKLDQGDLEAAVASFDEFLTDFGASDLRPNALFGKSLSLAGIGRNESSRATMQQFIDENPNHPLITEAQLVMDALN